MNDEDKCNCKIPYLPVNGVCGLCLLPLKGTVHGEGGTLIEDDSEDHYDWDEDDDPDFNGP